MSYRLKICDLAEVGRSMLRSHAETELILSHHQVHELVGHYDLFYHALAVYMLSYGWLG